MVFCNVIPPFIRESYWNSIYRKCYLHLFSDCLVPNDQDKRPRAVQSRRGKLRRLTRGPLERLVGDAPNSQAPPGPGCIRSTTLPGGSLLAPWHLPCELPPFHACGGPPAVPVAYPCEEAAIADLAQWRPPCELPPFHVCGGPPAAPAAYPFAEDSIADLTMTAAVAHGAPMAAVSSLRGWRGACPRQR
jgi:hypothetical protein